MIFWDSIDVVWYPHHLSSAFRTYAFHELKSYLKKQQNVAKLVVFRPKFQNFQAKNTENIFWAICLSLKDLSYYKVYLRCFGEKKTIFFSTIFCGAFFQRLHFLVFIENNIIIIFFNFLLVETHMWFFFNFVIWMFLWTIKVFYRYSNWYKHFLMTFCEDTVGGKE